jgi:hypothetical protein
MYPPCDCGERLLRITGVCAYPDHRGGPSRLGEQTQIPFLRGAGIKLGSGVRREQSCATAERKKGLILAALSDM